MTPSTMSPNRRNKFIKIILPPAFWLGVWQLAAMLVGRELLLPSPAAVAKALWSLLGTGDFWLSALYTLLRVAAGLIVGTAAGLLLAFLGHYCPWAGMVLAPAVRVVRATPVVSFILLVYLWVSRANIPGVIAALMVLPVIWGSVSAGLEAVDHKLLELARAYRFGPGKTLRLVTLPSLRPYFESGLLTAFGLAWKSGVAAEVICPPTRAIGSRIQQARLALETPELFAWTLVLIALSLSFEWLLRRLLGRKGAAV